MSQAGERGAVGAPLVGVVILNWRRPVEILETLASLYATRYPSLQVVVVDNGSANGSVERIRTDFPLVQLLENGSNLGFAEGNNVGIRSLFPSSVDYVFLLNDDTLVAPDLLTRLVATAESDTRIGIVGPTIYYESQRERVWSAGGRINALGEPGHLEVEPSATRANVREVDYVSGCGMLVSRRTLESVGLLDPRFFAYFEETEWCARARRAGFRVVHDPSAVMWHKIPTADRSSSPIYVYLMSRNRLLYLRCQQASRTTRARAILSMVRGLGRRIIRGDNPTHPMALGTGLLHGLLGRYGPPPSRI